MYHQQILQLVIAVVLVVSFLVGCANTAPTSIAKAPTTTTSVTQPTSTRKAVAGLPTSTATTMTANEKKQMLLAFLELLIENPEYDKNSDVLHKYTNALDIRLIGKTLTFIVQRQPDTADEFVQLGVDLILAGTLISQPGKPDDWGLTRIEVISPGLSENSATLYVTGHDDLIRLAQEEVSIYDIMQTKIEWGYALAEIIVSALNMRSGPGMDHQIIGRLTVGNQLEIIGINSTGDWLQVIDDRGDIGWISGKSEYTRVLGSLDNVPIVPDSSPLPTSAAPGPTPTINIEIVQCLLKTPPDQRDQCYEQSKSNNGDVPTYPKRTQECVPWIDAEKHINETTCVWGIVTSTYNSENAFFINFSETDYSVFYGVSFDYIWDDLEGRCIILHGLIQTYEGRPEIIIEHTNQLESCD